LFIVSTVSPMVIGYDVGTRAMDLIDENYGLDSCYESGLFAAQIETAKTSLIETEKLNLSPIFATEGLTGHIWPQQGYNAQHLGRSSYSTASNPGVEKWRFPAGDWCWGSPSIGPDGTIYFGSSDGYLYAVYPNGTLKWKFKSEDFIGNMGDHPAIADDGTIYFGTSFGSYIQAVNPNGTTKWKYQTIKIHTSITLGPDGMLYYGGEWGIEARYPNGTIYWDASVDCVQSTPAVDENNNIYFGSHNYNIYAYYPNGTMKWSYQTGHWVHGSPTIASDGTIYCGSDDDYVYALYPNGTLKWKTLCASGMRCSPSLDKDGNLYFGVSDNKLYSLDPDGNIRWSFTIRDRDGVWGSTAAISDDGTVYFGSHIDWGMLGGGEIIALDLDGNLKWRKTLCDSVCRSSPVIGEDGTVYICSSNDLLGGEAPGYLHAFGPGDIKQIELEYPEPGWLYLFGRKILPTPRGKTYIIGDCNVKATVSSEDELECVEFYISDSCKFTDYEAPYEWKIDQRFSDYIYSSQLLVVKGQYKGGCEWTESLNFEHIHL